MHTIVVSSCLLEECSKSPRKHYEILGRLSISKFWRLGVDSKCSKSGEILNAYLQLMKKNKLLAYWWTAVMRARGTDILEQVSGFTQYDSEDIYVRVAASLTYKPRLLCVAEKPANAEFANRIHWADGGETIWWLSLDANELKELKSDMSEGKTVTLNVEYNMGDSYQGPKYQIGSAGAAGDGATASDFEINLNWNVEIPARTGALGKQLEQLVAHIEKGESPSDGSSMISKLREAKQAASEGNEAGALEKLKGVGKWVLDAATKIGTGVAVAAIKHSNGW